jgi:cytochrome c6
MKPFISGRASIASLRLTLMLMLTLGVQAQDGAATYKSKCLVCHGADGKGSAMGLKLGASDLTSPEVQQQADAQLTEVILKGKGKMPGFEDRLKDTEIKDVVAFVRTLGKK